MLPCLCACLWLCVCLHVAGCPSCHPTNSVKALKAVLCLPSGYRAVKLVVVCSFDFLSSEPFHFLFWTTVFRIFADYFFINVRPRGYCWFIRVGNWGQEWWSALVRSCVMQGRHQVSGTGGFSGWFCSRYCSNSFLFHAADAYMLSYLQCFDAVGWAAGRASGL